MSKGVNDGLSSVKWRVEKDLDQAIGKVDDDGVSEGRRGCPFAFALDGGYGGR